MSDDSTAASSTELARQRTGLAEKRTELARGRTGMAENRTGWAEQRTEFADHRTGWAADRTFWAADRTLIAWLRTSISLIGFGITLGKAGDALETQGIILDGLHGLQIVGVSLIVLAILGLAGALIQDLRFERRIVRQGYRRREPTPLGFVMGFLVLAIGIFGIIIIVV